MFADMSWSDARRVVKIISDLVGMVDGDAEGTFEALSSYALIGRGHVSEHPEPKWDNREQVGKAYAAAAAVRGNRNISPRADLI